MLGNTLIILTLMLCCVVTADADPGCPVAQAGGRPIRASVGAGCGGRVELITIGVGVAAAVVAAVAVVVVHMHIVHACPHNW